jgi:UDP-N-acetylglucosamine--N-acetylmuramyl-(pentapeptide) pyrophosphoryl-undecaprenol N-acetylglucosamine transferase
LVDIVFTGGGTAGHVTPNIALFPDLQKKGYALAYIGQANSIEAGLISSENIPFYAISAGKLRRYFDFKNLTDLLKILLGFIQALSHLIRLKPRLVFSKGGFVSTPVVWAAWLCRIPVIIHESDISPGLANKLSLPFATKIAYSFPETKQYLPENKRVHTGLAIRDSLSKGSAEQGLSLCGFSSDKPSIVIIGGSQGSRTLNTIVRSNLTSLIPEYNICHLCGAGEVDEALINLPGYQQFEYLNQELPDVFKMASLIISRAGATSLFEFLALKKPSLLIPLPLGASRGDQILNARSFEKQGLATTVEETELVENPGKLVQLIKECFSKSEVTQKNIQNFLKEDGKTKIISLIEQTI